MPTQGQSLVGFLDQQAGINHLRNSCVVADPSDAALLQEWQAAKAKLGPPVANAGRPDIQMIPADGLTHIQTLLQQDWMKQAVAGHLAGAAFQLVEIDPLLAFQFSVDVDRSNHHNNGIQGVPTLADLLNVCLPIQQTSEPIQVHQAPGAMMVTSRSLNYQALAQGFIQNCFLGLYLGVSVPLVHVVRHSGRCYLHNGFHRAVGLRKRGATHVPCVFRDVPDHQAIGIKPGTFDATLLESADPPTLAHFTRDLAYDVQMKAFSRTIHVSWAEYVTTHE